MSSNVQPLADRERPWIGLASFTEGDSEFFAGRGEQSDDLLRLIHRDTLTLLYGVSGIGKTSLLQAGLFPALRGEGFLPVPIRLDYLEDSMPLVAQVHRAIAKAASAAGVERPESRADETLWEYFHRLGHDFWSRRNDPVTPVLVFDQFEEIFTHGRENPERARQAEAFVAELAELVENRAPSAFRADPERAAEFNFRPVRLKVLLAMREDYLAELDRLRARFRELGKNRLRLLPMVERQARAVIALGQPLLAPGIADRILAFVAGGQGAGEVDIAIAPALLSLVLHELNERRLARGPDAKITADLLDLEQTRILESFYLRSLKGCPAGARTFIEDALLTAGGSRNSCALDDALAREGVTQTVLDTLVNRRLLSYEDRHRSRRVELMHDVLVPIVKASRDARRALAKLKAEQKRSRRRWREVARMVGLGAVLLIGGLVAVCSLLVIAVLVTQAAGIEETETIESYLGGILLGLLMLILPVVASVAWLRARKRAKDATNECEKAAETQRKVDVAMSVVDFEMRTRLASAADPQALQAVLERVQEVRNALAERTDSPAPVSSTQRVLASPVTGQIRGLLKRWAVPLLFFAFAAMTLCADYLSSRISKHRQKRRNAEDVLAVYQKKIDEATAFLQKESDVEMKIDLTTHWRLRNVGAFLDNMILHNRIGIDLESQKKFKEALEAYRRALEISERVNTEFPNDRVRQYDLAIGLWNVGRLMNQLNQDGKPVLRRALEIIQRLEAEGPLNEAQRGMKDELQKVLPAAVP